MLTLDAALDVVQPHEFALHDDLPKILEVQSLSRLNGQKPFPNDVPATSRKHESALDDAALDYDLVSAMMMEWMTRKEVALF